MTSMTLFFHTLYYIYLHLFSKSKINKEKGKRKENRKSGKQIMASKNNQSL